MDKSLIQKKLDRRGFTIPEVLVVIAIMVLLFSFVAPNLIKISRNLKMTELDGTAREIFLTAQNEMTGKKASGQLKRLIEDGTTLGKDEITEGGVTKTLYYMNNQTAVDSMNQLAVFLSATPGECILYLSPRTGDVTDVYYSKKKLTYEAVSSLRQQLGGTDNRDIRAKKEIGYYGGMKSSSVEQGEGDSEHLPETLELVNGEDLYLKLVYPQLEQGFIHPDKIQAAITVTDEHSHSVVLLADGTSAVDEATPEASIYATVNTDNNYTLYALLDSTIDGCSFTKLFPDLTPGDDITITASLSYDGTYLYKDAAVGTVNSLFAAKYKAPFMDGRIIHKKGVEFSQVRHLSNLRYYDHSNQTAVQIADIDFNPEIRKKTMMPVSKHLEEIKEYFSPLDLNTDGFTMDGKDGRGTVHILSNFNMNGVHAGLLGNCTGSFKLINLQLQDFRVTGSVTAGTLIGRIHSNGKVIVDHCGAYQSADGYGWVLGKNQTRGQIPTGGLLGVIEADSRNEIIVNDSYSALNVSNSTGPTGGLIGKIRGGSQAAPVVILNSYASGTTRLKSKVSAAGGLVGEASDTLTILNSFSSTNVYVTGFGGTLIGSGTGRLLIEGSYACGYVVTTNQTETTAFYGPLVTEAGNQGVITFSNCRYLSQSGNKQVADAYGLNTPMGVSACEYDQLAADNGGKPVHNNVAACHPYADDLKGTPYPFMMVTREYYGDWPLSIPKARKAPYGLCYYEKYIDPSGTISFGMYGYDEKEELTDSLDHGNQKGILSAGYGILVPLGTSEVSAPDLGWGNKATLGEKFEIEEAGKDLYPLPNAASELMTHNNQRDRQVNDYQSGRSIYLNPLFAAAISKEVLWVDESHPLQIRTEDQLRARSLISDSGWYFKQTHNISILQSDTGRLNNNTSCTYDGGGNAIINLQQPLFSRNLGTVKELNLSQVKINQSYESAALVLQNQGLISNCQILSGEIVSGGNVAGLVLRSNGGTITNCMVGSDNGLNPLVIKGKGTDVAGMVAVTEGSGLVISGCKVMNTEVTNEAGCSAGFVGSNTATVTGCSVEGDVNITGNIGSGFVGSNRWNGVVDRCRASGRVTSLQNNQGASGMVWLNNGGTIRLSLSTTEVIALNGGNASGFADSIAGGGVHFCYWNGTATAEGSGSASGFCRNLAQGEVSNSFAVGTVRSLNGMATGFIKDITRYNGFVNNCYAAVQVTATGTGTKIGFTTDIDSCQGNYWVQQSGFNDTVTQSLSSGRINSLSFNQLKTLKQMALNWKWDLDSQSWTFHTLPEQTHPATPDLKGQSYPYPRITGLEYYGDWPVG